MIKCPVCGKYEFQGENDYDVCEVCGWENERYQINHPDEDGGANYISLNEAREAWEKGIALNDARKAKREGKSIG